VANKAQKKIHAATTIEVGHNDGGSGGDGVVKNNPIDNVDTNRCRCGRGLGAGVLLILKATIMSILLRMDWLKLIMMLSS